MHNDVSTDSHTYTVKIVRVHPGERITVRMPYSEVCCFLRVAGQDVEIELLPGLRSIPHSAVVQLYKDGQHFSFPILASEAGVHVDREGWYAIRMEDYRP